MIYPTRKLSELSISIPTPESIHEAYEYESPPSPFQTAAFSCRQNLMASPLLSPTFAPFLSPGSSPIASPLSPLLGMRKMSFNEDDLRLRLPDEFGLTVPEATFNLSNVMIGVGVLSVPYAFKQSGYSVLLILLIVILITSATGKWIGASLELAAKSKDAKHVAANARDFAFLAQLAFGNMGGTVINVVTVFEIWSALVTFMVMNGGNVRILWPSLNSTLSVTITGTIATLCCFIPDRFFSYLSLVSTLSLIIAAVAMVVSASMLPAWKSPPFGDSALLQISNVPRSVGILIFCFAGHPCFPAVYASMADKPKWRRAINITFLNAFIFYGAMGFFGYVVFGGKLHQTFTENIADIQGALVCRNIAAGCFLVKVQLTIPLLLNAIMVALWPPQVDKALWTPPRVILAFMVSGLTCVLAMALADAVAVVASLTGNLFVMTTSVLFPVLVYIALSRRFGERNPPTVCSYIKFGFVLVFGVTMAILGTYMALKDLKVV